MDFNVDCECGVQLTVRKTEAGSIIQCDCGREVRVPTMAQLRRSVGLVGVELSAAEDIAAKLSNGTLPPSTCIACEGKADSEIRLFAECEKSHQKTTNSYHWVESLLTTIFLPGIWLFWEESTEIQGRDTVVSIPMNFCSHCKSRIPRFWHFGPIKILRVIILIAAVITLVTRHHYFWYFLVGFLVLGLFEFVLRNLNQSNCKSLMKNVKEYSRLLDDFPEAEITN